MIILGLTGSIGMGKSTVAAMLRQLRIPVYEADAAVHALYARADVVRLVGRAFPSAIINNTIDRQQLGRAVFGNPAAMRLLQKIIYPILHDAEEAQLRAWARARRPFAVLDVPLLFETGGRARVDAAMVVDAPAFIQRQRVLRRPGMTPDKLRAVMQNQCPNHHKCRMADAVIPTGLGRAPTMRALKQALRHLQRVLAGRRPKWNTFGYARNRS
jgi:dephospho-CoA kinase